VRSMVHGKETGPVPRAREFPVNAVSRLDEW
jgi:hypothetical protein